MSQIETTLNTNPFLALLTERAQEKGQSIQNFCQALGYSPKVLEALAENGWLKPSNLTLAALAQALGQNLPEVREMLNARPERKAGRVSNSELGEMVNLYELMPASERYHLMEDIRRRAESYFGSLEPATEQPAVLDDAATLAEIQKVCAGLPSRAKQDLLRLLKRVEIHHQELVKDDQARRLGFADNLTLDQIL